MSTTSTPNLGLVKPTLGTGEHADVSVINENMDKIDAAVGIIGALQTAAWSASSTSSSGANLTDKVTVSDGVYLFLFNTAKPSGAMEVSVHVSNVGFLGWVTIPQNGRISGAFAATITGSHDVYLKAGSSASTTYSETSGAALTAVRLK